MRLNANELLSRKKPENKTNCNVKKRNDNVNENVVPLPKIQSS